MTARSALAEAFAETIVDDPLKVALLQVAAETTDLRARRLAIDALADAAGVELGDAIALEVVQLTAELTR